MKVRDQQSAGASGSPAQDRAPALALMHPHEFAESLNFPYTGDAVNPAISILPR
jgi:hypothetical protein